LKKLTRAVKHMEEGKEAWKKDQRGRYARIADDKCKLEIASLQKEKEVEVNAMREKNDPRMTERGSREEEYNASLDQTRQLLHSVRQQQAYLQDLKVVVEGERDQLRGMVKMLQKEVEGLRGVKEEAASYKGKAMQRAQALERATAAITKAECEIRRLKANREKPKPRVEGGESEGEEATASTATIYQRAEGLRDSILGVVGKSGGTFGRVWGVVMRNKNVVDAFSKTRLKPYNNEADVRDSEMVDCIRDLVQWAKAHHKTTHGRQVYETLCTAVADCRK